MNFASWDAAMNQIRQFLGGSDWRMPAAFYDGSSDASTESLFAELIDDVRKFFFIDFGQQIRRRDSFVGAEPQVECSACSKGEAAACILQLVAG
jgi:hypothetical protein